MAKRVIRLTIQVDLDKNLTCDDETIQNEFNGSIKELVEWLIDSQGIWDVIDWGEDEPILKNAEEIEVE